MEDVYFTHLKSIIGILKDNGLETKDYNYVIDKINSKCVRGNFGEAAKMNIHSKLRENYGALKNKDYEFFSTHDIDLGDAVVNDYVKANWSKIPLEDKRRVYRLLSKMFNLGRNI